LTRSTTPRCFVDSTSHRRVVSVSAALFAVGSKVILNVALNLFGVELRGQNLHVSRVGWGHWPGATGIGNWPDLVSFADGGLLELIESHGLQPNDADDT